MNRIKLYSLAVVVATGVFSTTAPATDWLWQVTTDTKADYAPSWSPDGTTIAFTSTRSGNPDIWTIPAGGGVATQITTDPAYDTYSAWSPDGTTLAFSSNTSGNWDIWTIPATGGPVTQITTDPAYDEWPAWSPDGFAISFGSKRSGNWDIWVIVPEHTTIAPASFGEVKALFR